MIRIRSIKDGFRRCGVAHPAKPIDYSNDHFTKEELKILKNEPMLFVEEGLPDPPGKKDDSSKSDKGKK